MSLDTGWVSFELAGTHYLMAQRTEIRKNTRALADAKNSSSLKGGQLWDQTGASSNDELLNMRAIHVDNLYSNLLFVYQDRWFILFQTVLWVIPDCTWILVGNMRTCLNSSRSSGSAQWMHTTLTSRARPEWWQVWDCSRRQTLTAEWRGETHVI